MSRGLPKEAPFTFVRTMKLVLGKGPGKKECFLFGYCPIYLFIF